MYMRSGVQADAEANKHRATLHHAQHITNVLVSLAHSLHYEVPEVDIRVEIRRPDDEDLVAGRTSHGVFVGYMKEGRPVQIALLGVDYVNRHRGRGEFCLNRDGVLHYFVESYAAHAAQVVGDAMQLVTYQAGFARLKRATRR